MLHISIQCLCLADNGCRGGKAHFLVPIAAEAVDSALCCVDCDVDAVAGIEVTVYGLGIGKAVGLNVPVAGAAVVELGIRHIVREALI